MMNDFNNSTFDAIFPLGGCCAITFQLKHRGKRVYASPFDWTLIPDERGIDYLPEGIASDFSLLLRKENLKEFAPKRIVHGKPMMSYEDTATGFQFVHHFHRQYCDPGVFEGVRARHDRRLARMASDIDSGKYKLVLFVLVTKFSYETHKAIKIYEALKNRYPKQDIHLRVIQFRADVNSREEITEGLLVERFVRSCNETYDMLMTSAEWEFLDWIEVTTSPSDARVRRKSLLIKLIYKLWIHLGKYLERKKAGCLSIRFKTR